LATATTYFYRAYATNSLGTTYGDEYTFTTEAVTGSGTLEDPYNISHIEGLNWISENPTSWNSHFIQTADIDASATSNWNNGEGFIPIGNETVIFTGHYNGQGNIIDGLTINSPTLNELGLFGLCCKFHNIQPGSHKY